jgi:hypothetical protein
MPDFRIISLSMVKNEQDIIEPFIRHNARYLDYMVILDNASVDETRRIALDCAGELKKIIVGDSDEFAYNQPERMTRLLHHSQSVFLPDFVLLLDADEFISAEDREAFERALRTVPPGGAGLMPWRTFVHVPGENGRSAEDPPRFIRYRRAVETPLFHKVVLRLDRTYRSGLEIAAGNHSIRTMSGERVPMVPLDDLPLLHFPLRSRSQVIAKAVVGWMAHTARNPNARQEGLGYQWRDAFDRIAAGSALLTEADLCQMSMRYAQERVEIDWSKDVVAEEPPLDYIRRYSAGSFAEPIALIARSWERSLAANSPPRHIEALFTDASVRIAAPSIDAVRRPSNSSMDAAPFRYNC